ncbi:hypothetical protein SAMN05444369_10867 [Capnocytophaga haemolytica]|uniref:Uncharacterized protein n=1 Tax=Capnocytophaga haemolytica TaxID=45243 RepID=A0AAX2GZ69_9FLAO|nr:hypothetical protein [Capnocytophaga haemolytica]AMD84105.1 hypothetical protein AXF12_00245 [Capnocytophaga haemolytica]SFO06829.1 hypothetical protein SAMN05444369_10867 [Capnocytophaga haemolytica]SNV13451.1 Uncharacterised protein [Capnocytophaga haemolytica]
MKNTSFIFAVVWAVLALCTTSCEKSADNGFDLRLEKAGVNVSLNATETVRILSGNGGYRIKMDDKYKQYVEATISGTTVVLEGKAEGEAILFVYDAIGKSAKLQAVVQKNELRLSKTEVRFTATGTTATVEISGGTESYTVSTSDATVAQATVSGSTVSLTALKWGTATVTVTDVHTAQQQTIAVTVQEETLTFSLPAVELAVGATQTLTITSGTASYTLSGFDRGVATATVSGTVISITGVATGTTTLTVTDSKKVKGDVPITIKE